MPNIWLFTGAEIGEKNAKIDDLKKQATKTHGSVDFHLMYAYETSIYEVLNTLQSGSLFVEAQFVVLRFAELIKDKNEIAALKKWADGSGEDSSSYLVLVSDENSVGTSLANCVPESNRTTFWEMFENKKHEWVSRFFQNNCLSIEGGAIDELLEVVENNTEALKNACSSLVMFFDKGKHIGEGEISSLLAHNKEETVFSLFDAMTKRNNTSAFAILQKLLMEKDASVVSIVAGLVYCFRRLLDFHRVTARTGGNSFEYKKVGIASKTAIAQYQRAARIWDMSMTMRIIGFLGKMDAMMRSNGGRMQAVLMDMCIYKIINANRGQGLDLIH